MAQLERSGISTVVLATTAFEIAAREQWQALGFSTGAVATVGHPLGSMTLPRVLAEAEKAVNPTIALLSTNAGGG
jgi:hypothetical protein